MRKLGVRRLNTQSALPVALIEGNGHEIPWLFRLFLRLAAPIRPMFQEKIVQEQIIEDSGLDWVTVRPAMLTNNPATGSYRVGTPLPGDPARQISRTDVADFMLRQVTDNSYLYKVQRLSY
jgi:hypothetical protein